MLLEEYNLDIKYIKGRDNVAADGMSRLSFDKEEANKPEEVMWNRKVCKFDSSPVAGEFLEQAQNGDIELNKWIKEGHPTKIFEKNKLGDNLWAYRSKRWDERSLIFVPKANRETLTEWYHDTFKYPGAERLLFIMRVHFNQNN